MVGTGFMFVIGIVSIIFVMILWIPMNFAVEETSSVFIGTLNQSDSRDAIAIDNINSAEEAFFFSLFVIIIVIVLVTIRDSPPGSGTVVTRG